MINDNFEKMVNLMQGMLLDYKMGKLTRKLLISNLKLLEYMKDNLPEETKKDKN